MRRSEHVKHFSQTIWDWFSLHKRDLPWRDLKIKNDTDRAYRILVSEIMLQQTQVSRVVIIYKRFLERFPHISDLAAASNQDVILAWRGMGYNSRALRLRDAAATIIKEYDGFPKEMGQLLSIKGIGHYTAAAVRNFAFNLPTPCLDTNIRRILHRAFIGPENEDGTWQISDKDLLPLAQEVLESALQSEGRTTADWHAALMDFGSLVCTKTNPKWEVCPLTEQGLMKAAYKVPTITKSTKKEPGRLVGSTYVPNRIFRGKVVEELRDHADLTLHEIGRRICIDWSEKEHATWLASILSKLESDSLIREQRGKYALA